ncbi:Ferroportin1-domain-containing protein [Xylariaceae sp. FL1019]|nr:Ferroportin1-domain-containing protein [Xylariaceae sp. FL1019]
MEPQDDPVVTLEQESLDDTHHGLSRAQALNLYVSHAFSTWNARGYEFAAILFTAGAYPDTLVAAALRLPPKQPASNAIYSLDLDLTGKSMIIIYVAMIFFSSSVGQWVQRSPDRLRTLLSTILCNRGSVILGSFVWLFILSQENSVANESPANEPLRYTVPQNDILKGVVFAVAIAFGIVERLSASGNMISMERDWIVTAAAPLGKPWYYAPPSFLDDLTNLNAVMRRIDLVCKLIAPIAISIIISATGSVRVGVVYTALTSLISIPIELLSAKRVWNACPVLQAPKLIAQPRHTQEQESTVSDHRLMGIISSWQTRVRQHFHGFETYFSTKVWVPSVALALLHFNMLTWRATFITYLINLGYSLNVITLARTIGSVFEISSTVITPWGIAYLGKTRRRGTLDDLPDGSDIGLLQDEETHEDRINDAQTVIGLQRLGLWGMSSQVVNTVPVVFALWVISNQRSQETEDGIDNLVKGTKSLSVGWSVILFSFLAFSRLGVWIFDLTTQQLTQMLVPKTERSSFAGVETSIVNIFEVLGAATAISFPHVSQYRWLALASLISVVISWFMYSLWVRTQRGHLVHWEKIPRGLGEGARGT